jgi:RimJ/RimL family protein N-acetyltransferase
MIETMLPHSALDFAVKPSDASVLTLDRRRLNAIPPFSMIDVSGAVMKPIVRKLCANDAAAYQSLRLEGLLNHPCEFGTAFEEEVDLSVSEVGRRLDEGRIYGAFQNGKLAAIAGFRRFDRIKKAHKAELFGVYAGKAFRGKGLGEAVLRMVIEVARGEVEQLLATVASVNAPAKALYAKLGFVAFGHEPRAQKVGDLYYDQDHLILIFT